MVLIGLERLDTTVGNSQFDLLISKRIECRSISKSAVGWSNKNTSIESMTPIAEKRSCCLSYNNELQKQRAVKEKVRSKFRIEDIDENIYKYNYNGHITYLRI